MQQLTLGALFRQHPWKFRFVTLPRETPDKLKRYPGIFKNVSHLLEIPWPVSKTGGNSTLFCLDHPWNFHILFFQYLCTFYFFNSMSSTPLLPPPPRIFFLKWPIHAVTLKIFYHLYISSFWWAFNVLLWKFDTSSRKKMKIIKL